MMGTITAVALCRRTIELGWTLPVRKLYLERASMAMQNLLPLAIPSPMAAARLTALQGRWAKLVLYGKAYHMYNDLTRPQTQTMRQDLGWKPLWGMAREHAIMLYQRMRNQPMHLPHTQWARQEPAPRGTWVAYVRSMQTSLGIPKLDIQDPREGSYSKAAMKLMYKQVRQKRSRASNTGKKKEQSN